MRVCRLPPAPILVQQRILAAGAARGPENLSDLLCQQVGILSGIG